MWPILQTAELATFSEEILNEKLHFLCSDSTERTVTYFRFCSLVHPERRWRWGWHRGMISLYRNHDALLRNWFILDFKEMFSIGFNRTEETIFKLRLKDSYGFLFFVSFFFLCLFFLFHTIKHAIFSFIENILMELFRKPGNWRQQCKQTSSGFCTSNDASL